MKKRLFKNKEYKSQYMMMNRPQKVDQVRKEKIFRHWFKFCFWVLLLAGLIYFFVYSPVFQVNKILISGSQKIEILNEVQRVVQEEISGYDFFVLPKKNIFYIDLFGLEKKVREEVMLDELSIEKKYLRTLKIYATDKSPVILWKEGNNYYYLDRKGVVLRAINFEQLEYDLPIVNRGTTTQVLLNDKLVDQVDIEFIQKVYKKFAQKIEGVSITEVVARELRNNELYFYTNEGWYFILLVDGDVDDGLEKLKLLLEQKIEDRSGLQYVDLRISDKIFYK